MLKILGEQFFAKQPIIKFQIMFNRRRSAEFDKAQNQENILNFTQVLTPSSKQQNQQKQLIKEWSDLAENWPRLKRSVKVYQLSELGIPPKCRKTIWHLAVGNKLSLTRKLYEILCNSAKTFKPDQRSDSRLATFNHISQDIGRTFQFKEMQNLFHPGGPYSEVLMRQLQAFCLYRPDIGYVQGMTYVSAILLMNLDEYEAFVVFSSLATHPLLLPIYLLDEKTAAKWFNTFEKLMKINVPHVLKTFKHFNINCDMYLLEWFLTLYAKPLNPDIVCRIWDRMLFSSTSVLWKCGIAILKLMAHKFTSEEQILQNLKNPDLREEELLREINLVKYPYEIQEEFSASCLMDSPTE